MKKLIYFDNAATTFPKPLSVSAAAARVINTYCANPGRSSHRLSLRASEAVYACRERIAEAFGGKVENVVFTSCATHSINLALKSTLRAGDHVLISDIEHNAVFRPVSELARRGYITFDFYSSSLPLKRMLAEINAKIKPNTALICACHHSNICNVTLPIGEIGKLCRRKGILFLVDASQSAGSIKINVEKQCIDMLCAPAHKGLYGIPGCGFTVFSETPRKISRFSTFIEGGNGIDSKNPFMPDFLPDRFEAGTLPLPAIDALSAGLDFVAKQGIENIYQKEKRLCALMRAGLSSIDGVNIHSKDDGSIMLFSVNGIKSESFAQMLDKHGVCVRAGTHCAPLAHKLLSTPEDGALRVSFGAFNTESEVIYFSDLCRRLVSGKQI